MNKDSLGDRMKGYEYVTRHHLVRRTPVIVRVDGKAFHTYTRRLKEVDDLTETPFSPKLRLAMSTVASALLTEMQNAVFAYVQSDEVSVLLRDWDRYETQQWFDGVLPKIVSVSASIATATFNFAVATHMREPQWLGDLAFFDARAYNLPKEEVTNYFIWRQQDATRNSIQMLGRHYFSQKQLLGKSVGEIQDMLMAAHGVNWNDIDTWMKRGTACYHNPDKLSSSHRVIIDNEPPIFTQDRLFVEKYLEVDNGDSTATDRTGN